MKLIYVASPYAGDVEKNTESAKRACRHVMNEGHAFFAPHLLYPQLLDDLNPQERQAGLDMGLEVLRKCDELWCYGDRISPGMAREIEQAKNFGIPIQTISSEQIQSGQKNIYAIWAEARPGSSLTGSGFLCENRNRLLFFSQKEAEIKISDVRNLCLNTSPVADYRCMPYLMKMESKRNMHLETIRNLDMIPAFDPNKFEIRSKEYGNTGGNCMVGTVQFYLPEIDKSVWVNCNDESVLITSADYTWNKDGSESWERYEDVLLYSTSFSQALPDDAKPWFPLIQKTLEYTIEQETAYFKDYTFSLPVAWLPESIRQKVIPEYLSWLQAEDKEIRIAQNGRIELEEAYMKHDPDMSGMMRMV